MFFLQTYFGFLRVSSLLFKPLQVKEFLYGQVQTFDITMFHCLSTGICFSSNFILAKELSIHTMSGINAVSDINLTS